MSVTAGLNGWFRWGGPHVHAAHLFIDGVQQCGTRHGNYALAPDASRPDPAELAEWGLPYGRTCQRCTSVHHAKKKAATRVA